MQWLWFVAPLVTIFVTIAVSLWPSAEERRLVEAVRHWIDELLGPLDTGKTRRVRRVPPAFDKLLDAAGGGTRITDVVLVPKLAYAAIRVADMWSSSNHITVLCKLDKAAPAMVVRPLPIVDGRPIDNRGILFSKDEEFTDNLLVDGQQPKAIRKWLDDDTRKELLELPDLWLRTDGKQMALSYYGHVDVETLDEVVGVADALFAAKGPGAADSLFGEHEPLPKKKAKPKKEHPAPTGVRMAAGAIDFGLYLLATVALAAMLGSFDSFHPSLLFNSPDLVTTEPWQGGWTTKGIGAFIMAESVLAILFGYQAHLAARDGSSIGTRLLGARVVRVDGKRMDFFRGVLLRTWIFGAAPLVVAAAIAYRSVGRFTARSFFETVPTKIPFAVGAVVLAVLCALMLTSKDGRGLHDKIAGTKVVAAPGFTLATVQLGVSGMDPIVFKRLTRGLGVAVVFIIANVIAFTQDIGFWIY